MDRNKKIFKIIFIIIITISILIPKTFALNNEALRSNMENIIQQYATLKNGKYVANKNAISKLSKKEAEDLYKESRTVVQSCDETDKKTNWYDAMVNITSLAQDKMREDSEPKDSDEKLKGYTKKQIKDWLNDPKNNPDKLSESVKKEWLKKINELKGTEKKKYQELLKGNTEQGTRNEVENDKSYEDEGKYIYKWPEQNGGGTKTATLESMMKDADGFIKDGTASDKLNETNLQDLSSDIYSTILQIGVAIAIIIGLILGIQFMMASVEGKAEIKKMLVVYLIGCIIVFGSFAIWKVGVRIIKSL